VRVLVTGSSGFVGRWLSEDLANAGHEVIPVSVEVDVRRAEDVRDVLAAGRPDAVAHLAAVAFAPDAATDPRVAFDVAVLGTINVLEQIRALPHPPAILVSGSSEVYGAPSLEDLPLSEASPLRPHSPYSLSKAAQEGVALGYAARLGLRVVVTRSFNHTGPGQRPEFVVPALARRVLAVANGEASEIPVGTVDVRRDLGDVRDVVRAYRRLLEVAVQDQQPGSGLVVNVCTGRSVAIREIVEELARLAGIRPVLRVDPALVRSTDAPEIRGDHSLLSSITGWMPDRALAETLRDVWAEVTASQAQAVPSSN
jgi:GDP-4-dehydro-6-deoxy-D-mannose reductase